jgi:hypothetical protein
MRFLVVSPRYYHKSEGVVVLHQLARDLQCLGHEARIIWLSVSNTNCDTFLINHNPRSSGILYNDLVIDTFDEYNPELDIVIYSEIVPGNPLAAKRVVRYFLNREGFCLKNNRVNPDPSDFIMAFHPEYVDQPKFILSKPTFDLSKVAGVEALEKHLNTYYVGKAAMDIRTPIIGDALNLDQIEDKAEYERALLLAKYVFTYDPMTSVIRDAILFGAIPVIVNHRPWKPEKIIEIHKGGLVMDLCAGQNIHLVCNQLDFWSQRLRVIETIRLQQVAYRHNLIEFTEVLKQYFSLSA